MKKMTTAVLITAAVLGGNGAWAAVSAAEAAQLGAQLTRFGAEKAGNKDGSIPEYTGGLPVTTAPPGFQKDSGKWVNPFRDEKPLFTITADNASKYADRLTEGAKALLKRHSTFRIDVYPTHRTVNYPDWYLAGTLRNATAAATRNDGVAVDNLGPGIPFPIPKTGYETMWNHLARYQGTAYQAVGTSFYADSSGTVIAGGQIDLSMDFPHNAPDSTADSVKKGGGVYQRNVLLYQRPRRVQGDGLLILDNLDPLATPRKAYSYSASTRRVRLAPDIAYDTPIASSGGVMVYDEPGLFFGKMDRFDFKLVGKREMIIPYNTYEALFEPTEKQMGPKHLNADKVRWELHRVWVIEATLKPGMRHIYQKRVFYLDEDWTGAGASDEYDGSGKLYKAFFQLTAALYDKQASWSYSSVGYDLATGSYVVVNALSADQAFLRIQGTLFPANYFSPDSLASRSKQ